MFAKDKIIERIVRVDQAGEIGAQRIYNGQRFVFKLLNNKKEYEIFSEMAQEEKEHLDYFNNLAKQKILNQASWLHYLILGRLLWELAPLSWVQKQHMFALKQLKK